MIIAEKIITDWNNKKPWALGDWGPEDLKDVVELITIVAERGIKEACKQMTILYEDDDMELEQNVIKDNRWWEKEA